MKIKLPENAGGRGGYPRVSPDAHFTPRDFAAIIAHLPEGCPLVGGQAVAWWAERYGIKVRVGDQESAVTSRDIDFWGGRSDLVQMATRLHRRPVFPHEYEMTVWVGAIEITVRGKQTIVEFLHTVPGLDTNNPDHACVEQEYTDKALKKCLPILTPVSLVLTKLHALRHFDQKARQDELHLKVSIEASKHFIIELLKAKEAKPALWNCQRLIDCHQMKPIRRLEVQHQCNILDAIPIAELRRESHNPEQPAEGRGKLKKFCAFQWPRVSEDGREPPVGIGGIE